METEAQEVKAFCQQSQLVSGTEEFKPHVFTLCSFAPLNLLAKVGFRGRAFKPILIQIFKDGHTVKAKMWSESQSNKNENVTLSVKPN